MTVQYSDRVRVSTSTTGTGTIALGAAVTGFRNFDTAVQVGELTSGATVYYTIEDGTAWEIGSGIYTTGSETLTRVVSASSLGGTALTLSGSAQVYLTTTAPLLPLWISTSALSISRQVGSNTASSVALTINGATGTDRLISWATAGSVRWAISTNSTAEAGSNAGSNFAITAYSDAGSTLFTPLTITRSTGLVSIANGLAISGTASAPTAALNNSSTQIATTAFVIGQASATAPLIAGTAAIGTATRFARADHVHPVDTGRQAALGFTPVTQGGGTGQGTNKVYIGYNSGSNAVKIMVDTTDLGNVVTTVSPQNYAQTNGNVTFSATTVAQAGLGSVQAVPGNASVSGYLQFLNASGTPVGYAGQAAAGGTIVLNGLNTGRYWYCNLNFNVASTMSVQNMVINGWLNAAQTLYITAPANNFYLSLDGAANRIMAYSTGWYHMWRAADGYYIYYNGSTPLYYSDGTGGGNFFVHGTMTGANVSDERTKRNVQPYTRGLADIVQLNPVSYEYNGLGGTSDDGKRQYGVTAQQAQPFVPECVSPTRELLDTRPDRETPAVSSRLPGQLSFNEKPLIFAALNALKEIDARLNSIEQTLGL